MSANVHRKPTPASDKVKRKRTQEEAGVVPTDKASAEKPSKKSRSDSATSKFAIEHATRSSGKKKGEEKKVKFAGISEPPTAGKAGRVEQKVKAKVKTLPQSPSNGGQEKQKATRPSQNFEPVSPAEDGGESEGSEVEEEEIHLQGFSSESDSSDEELHVMDASPLDISKLPAFSKDDAAVQRKLEKAKRLPTEDKGVLYLGRIPHGFHEDQMKAYFSQFGDVSRLRLSRNKKTGRSKHYAFIEFDSSAVADIVSETMDNYLLMGHIMRCKVIPKDQIHPELWIGANKKWRFVPRDRLARLKQNKPRTQEEQSRVESRLLARQKKQQAKIHALGIDYDFQGVAYQQKLET